MDIETERNKNKHNKIKNKNRLIAKMVAGVMMTTATATMIASFGLGFADHHANATISNLEAQKANQTDIAIVRQIDNEIADIKNKSDKRMKYFMPSAYTFIGSGLIGAAINISDEIIQDKKKQKLEENQNTL